MPYDDFTVSEYLPDQTSGGTVLTFTFSQPMEQVWIAFAGQDNDVARVRVDGINPTLTTGTPVYNKSQFPISGTTSQVRVLAPADAVVSVWGYSR